MGDTNRYRTRASIVDAFTWDGRDLHGLGDWASRADMEARKRRGDAIPLKVSLPIDAVSLGGGRWRLEIKTPDGTMRAAPGDIIVCMPDGAFHPCKPSLFAAMFESLDEGLS